MSPESSEGGGCWWDWWDREGQAWKPLMGLEDYMVVGGSLQFWSTLINCDRFFQFSAKNFWLKISRKENVIMQSGYGEQTL